MKWVSSITFKSNEYVNCIVLLISSPVLSNCRIFSLLPLHSSALIVRSQKKKKRKRKGCREIVKNCLLLFPWERVKNKVPGGLRPGELRPGGLRPGGLRPWGIEPTWLRPRWTEAMVDWTNVIETIVLFRNLENFLCNVCHSFEELQFKCYFL